MLSASKVAPGDTLTADATGSTGKRPLTYVFEWGDGELSSSASATATHVYTTLGTFTVKLTVQDANGNAAATAPIAVWSNSAPVVRFSWASGVLPGDPVPVDASDSTAINGIASYTFAVAGGETRTQTTPTTTFTFDHAGGFALEVTVTDRAGNAATQGALVDVGLKCNPKVRVPSEAPSLFRSGEHFARDAAGTIYAIWFDAGGLAFSRSLDGGASFEPQTTIVDAAGPFHVDILGSSLAVSDDGVVHIAWGWDEGDFGYVRSLDGGETFTPISLFHPVQDSVSFAPAIATSGTDRVTVSWLQSAPGPSLPYSLPYSSPVATSANAGETYSVQATLPADDPNNCNTSIAYDGSTLVAAWHGANPNGFGPANLIEVAISTDDGATFSAPLTLDTEQTTFCPSVVAQHGHIGVSWIAGSIVENQRVMLAISDDHGATFRTPVVVTPSFAKANCTHMTFDSAGNVYVAYTDNGGVQIEHNLLASSDGGRTFGPPLFPTAIFDNGDCAAVNALAPGQLELIWSEPRLDGTGLYEVYYTTATMTLP